ncbi:MAG: OmpA family protein [Myxococcales bacterium]
MRPIRLAGLLFALVLFSAPCALADGGTPAPRLRERFGMRFSAYLSLFVSSDQTDQLGFDRFGLLGDLSMTVNLLPWLTTELGGTGGSFLIKKGAEFVTYQLHVKPNGGLLAPTLGVRVHAPNRQLSPFVAFSAGPAFTGELIRPLLQASFGLDIAVRRGVTLGPYFGYGRVLQKNGPEYTTDASYFSVGITMAYRPLPPQKPRVVRTHSIERVVERIHTHSESPPREPPVDDKELDQLLDQALPPARTDRMELLAPVLFAFDSDQLEPVGVAMLHEVASLLKQRPDIELLAILGFADKRGSSTYNLDLSTRRAERVRAWLIEHGIEGQRLEVQTQGATNFVEAGESEAEHEQNRRVIFRVLRLRSSP